jgi:hypothetical protein
MDEDETWQSSLFRLPSSSTRLLYPLLLLDLLRVLRPLWRAEEERTGIKKEQIEA